jgi:endo-1,4-beta-xylanase
MLRPKWIAGFSIWLICMAAGEESMAWRYGYIAYKFSISFIQWDVYNEQLHGAWFEEKSGNRHFLRDTFVKTQNLFPGVKLLLNDFNLLNGPEYTAVGFCTGVNLLSLLCLIAH